MYKRYSVRFYGTKFGFKIWMVTDDRRGGKVVKKFYKLQNARSFAELHSILSDGFDHKYEIA